MDTDPNPALAPPHDAREHVADLTRHLVDIHARYAALRDGTPASYIPEIAEADPDWFGITIVSTVGRVLQVGDFARSFTIQYISKPFVYGLALEELHRELVMARIGVEP